MQFINLVDNTKLLCYTLPLTQHLSFFTNLPPLLNKRFFIWRKPVSYHIWTLKEHFFFGKTFALALWGSIFTYLYAACVMDQWGVICIIRASHIVNQFSMDKCFSLKGASLFKFRHFLKLGSFSTM